MVGCEVTRNRMNNIELAYCGWLRRGMSCHLMSVTSFDAVLCRGDGELLSVVPCNGMECYELKIPLVVGSRCVVRSGSVTMW